MLWQLSLCRVELVKFIPVNQYSVDIFSIFWSFRNIVLLWKVEFRLGQCCGRGGWLLRIPLVLTNRINKLSLLFPYIVSYLLVGHPEPEKKNSVGIFEYILASMLKEYLDVF